MAGSERPEWPEWPGLPGLTAEYLPSLELEKRGAAVIISMERKRPGGSVDRGRLMALADSLGLKACDLVDYKAEDLREELKHVADELVVADDDCFLCFVNAPGGTSEQYIEDEDGDKILLEEILAPFRTCKQLRGKPKLFFVNSCRGVNKLTSAENPGPSDVRQPPYEQSVESSERRYVEDFADTLVAFSTSGGSVSARHPVQGTTFVTALVEAFISKRHTTDVYDIIKNVTYEVLQEKISWEDEGGNRRSVRQCPIVVSSLTKSFFLRPEPDISLVLRRIGLSQSRIDTGIRALEAVRALFKFHLQHVNEFARGLKLREEGLGRLEEAAFVPLILALLGRGAGALSAFTHVDLTCRGDLTWHSYLEGLKSFPRLDEDMAASLCANLGQESSQVRDLCLSGQQVFGTEKGCELLARVLRSNRYLKRLQLPQTGLGSKGVKLIFSGLKENQTLELLDIGDNPGIGDKGTGYVAELLVGNVPLKFLGLSGVGMGLGGLEALLTALSRNTTLQDLRMGGDPISEEGMELLLRVRMRTPAGIGDKEAGFVAELSGDMQLKYLELSGVTGMGLGGLEALLTALSRNTTLQDLRMGGDPISEEGMELLLRVRTPAKKSLTSIELGNMHISVESLASMIARNRSLTCLSLTDAPLSSDEWVEHIIPALNQNSTLKELLLTGANGVTNDNKFPVESLASMIARNRSLTCLGITGAPLSSDEWVEHIIPALNQNSTLKELHLTGANGVTNDSMFPVESLASMIARNWSWTCLGLQGAPLSSNEWVDHIIPALGKNATLKKLSVRGSKGVTPDFVLKAFIDMVDSSETALEVIDVQETPLSRAGMAGRLTEALRIRKEYGATLKGQSTRTPACGRLVLCGYEFSGKTTICRTMRRITDGELPTCHETTKMAFRNFFRKHSGWRHFLYGKQASRELEHRTRGYEIVVLRNESHRRTTIWDFAGQEEYYVLHDFILPNARNTCFLFVCSAVYPAYHDPQHLAGRPRTKDDMAKQFLYWLRFLASNAKPGTPPRVIFVLTNKDGLGTRAQQHTSTGWANTVVTEMKEKFENVIHLEERAVVVNAQNFGDITRLQDLVEKRLQDLLAQGPEEFVVCEHVRLALQKWAANNPSDNIIIKKELFQAICSGKVKQEMGYAEYAASKLATPDGQNAVLAYLNDAGEIIYPPTLDFIMLNPTWFGRSVLGSLIDAFGSTREPGGLVGGFIGYVKDCCLPAEGNEIWRGLNHQHGFVAYKDVEELLETSLRTTHLTKIVTPEDLIELMIKLDMCYKEKPEVKTSRLFIPAVFDDNEELAANGKRQLGWKLGRRPGSFHHVGRRLLCRNTTLTLLSPGFFPRLQVVLRNYYHSKGWTENQAFQIDRNLIGFAEDGHEVLVEYSGNIDYFVDILAKSDHTYLRTLQFIREHVMGKIINFCASPQGCPGVLLVDAVIRPICVEQLHLCADRIDHAVLVSDLEAKLANDDEKACKHIWKKEIQGTHIVNYAVDLLEGEDSYKIKRTSTRLQPALTQEDLDKLFQWSRLLDNRGHSRTTSSAPGIQQERTDDCYDSNVVEGQKRGIAVLISMEKYNSGDRLGGAVDRGQLVALAGSLSLEVIVLVDSPAAKLREQLMNIQKECVFSQDKCFVCFVNAHGNTTENGEHFITDKVGEWILLDDIVGPFRTCQKLRGKPKMFVVNSCRGRNIVAGAEAPGPSSDQRPYQQSSESIEYRYVKDLSDCLVAFSTFGGSVSARDPMSGTSFVTALVEAFNSKRHNTDVVNIISSVICAVVHERVPVRQCPIVVSSLTKRFFLR